MEEIRYECPRCRTLYLEEVDACDWGCGGVVKRDYSPKLKESVERRKPESGDEGQGKQS